VSWQKADILKPKTYQSFLAGADAVIHSMGILLEADYKGVLQGKESIVSGLQRAFSATKGGSQNPLERSPGESLQPQEKDGQFTYELMNRDSGMFLLAVYTLLIFQPLHLLKKLPSQKYQALPIFQPPEELQSCQQDISIPSEKPSPP
jgi:hypothetical protein